MPTWNEIRPFLETVTVLSNLAVACFAGIALRQLSIAKETSRTNARRESLKLAAEQCTHYLNVVIPLQNRLSDYINAKNLKLFTDPKIVVEGKTLRLKERATVEEISLVHNKEFLALATPVFNAMDAFAVFFTERVADESVAYLSIGATFCASMKRYLPYLALILPAFPNSYVNLWRLFFLWNVRFSEAELLRERNKIEEKLGSMDSQIIRPLGTE